MDTKQYTFDEDSISDLFKDAHGSRPGQGFWDRWLAATDDEKQAEWDWLCQVLEQEQARQEINYNSCIEGSQEWYTSLHRIKKGNQYEQMAQRPTAEYRMVACECVQRHA